MRNHWGKCGGKRSRFDPDVWAGAAFLGGALAGAVFVALIIWTLARDAAADENAVVSGEACAIDGDGLMVGRMAAESAAANDGWCRKDLGVEVRLHGIDAFEWRQTCGDSAGRPWDCGKEGKRALAALVAGRRVVCQVKDVDRKRRRQVAVCLADGKDLGREMVRAGLAVAYRRYSDAYVEDEAIARAARRGAWAGSFQAPEDWRRENFK